MKLARTLPLIVALAGAPPAFAGDPPPKAKAEKAKPAPAKPAPEKPADKPAEKPADAKPVATPEEARKIEAFFDDLFAAVVTNQQDCPKMGPAINGVLDKHEPFLKKMAGSDKEPPPALKAKIEKKQGDFVNALMKCTSDKGVTDALTRMTKLVEKK